MSAAASRVEPRLPWGMVAALSVAQVASWGSLIYAFTLFIEPMGRELGWSKAELSAAYSLGLAAAGLGAVPAGRLIDRGHGRLVMTGGSAAAAAFLALWAGVTTYPVFVLVWLGLGLAMSATLYEPAFAVLTRSLGPAARRGITAMTLVGGFASTVFVPLTHVLIEGLGWRGALLVLAACNGIGCALIHLLAVPAPKGGPPAPAGETEPSQGNARRVFGERAFWALVAAAALHSALLSGFIVHLVPVLVERGFTLESVVGAFALFGPAQVGARLVIAVTERVLSLKAVGVIAMALFVVAFALLPLVPAGSPLIFAFTILFGAANGLMTILRAILPAELFGRADYGTVQGLIATPATFAKAAGPFALAALWAWSGATGSVLACGLGLAIATALAFLVAILPSKSVAHRAKL